MIFEAILAHRPHVWLPDDPRGDRADVYRDRVRDHNVRLFPGDQHRHRENHPEVSDFPKNASPERFLPAIYPPPVRNQMISDSKAIKCFGKGTTPIHRAGKLDTPVPQDDHRLEKGFFRTSFPIPMRNEEYLEAGKRRRIYRVRFQGIISSIQGHPPQLFDTSKGMRPVNFSRFEHQDVAMKKRSMEEEITFALRRGEGDTLKTEVCRKVRTSEQAITSGSARREAWREAELRRLPGAG